MFYSVDGYLPSGEVIHFDKCSKQDVYNILRESDLDIDFQIWAIYPHKAQLSTVKEVFPSNRSQIGRWLNMRLMYRTVS